MKLYKSKKTGQLLSLKNDVGDVKVFWNLDENLCLIPEKNRFGIIKTTKEGYYVFQTSVIGNDNVEELNRLPDHIMESIGKDTSLELFSESTFDDGTYELKDDEYIFECEGYVLTLDVFYQKDVRKVSYIDEPEEEHELSVDVGIILKRIDYEDVEDVPFDFEQAKTIEKRLKENAEI